MKKKKFLFGILAASALVTLASCGNDEEIENLKKEVASLKEENETLKNDKEDLTSENNSLKNDKTALTGENNSLKEENATLKADKDKEASAKEDALSQIEQLVKAYEDLENKSIVLFEETKKDLWSDINELLKVNNSYAIKYTDPLGESVIKTFDSSDNIVDELILEFNADIVSSSYGSYIKSIMSNYVDPNWYVSIYENGESSDTGLDGLVVDSGDFFEFKYECWNTVESGFGALDSYDVLVDQVIYNYYVNVLPNKLASVDTYTGITYWDSLALYKLKNVKSYGTPIYSYSSTVNNPFSYNYLTTLNSTDQSELSGNNLFKYYYADRLIANNRDYTSLKTNYQNYLDTLTSYSSWGEYSNPFHTGVAKTLGLNLNDAIKNTTYRADTTYGSEGLAWELTGLACYNTLTSADLSDLTFDALNNEYVGSKDVALSTYMLPYAAANLNFRELKTSDGVDAIKYLFDNYYDIDTMQFETEKLSNDMSSNQIYAALVAYKVQRDTGNATNIFE